MAKTKDVYTHRFHARAMREREREERNSVPLICNARDYGILVVYANG